MSSLFQPIAALIEQTETIKKLSFKNMGLSSLPIDISRFPNLESIDLSGNNFKSLPVQMAKLKKLKSISLAKNVRMNWSKALMVLIECKKIESMDLSNNNLPELPAELFHFENLKRLNLSGNSFNPFSERNTMNLPDTISELIVLDCSYAHFAKRIKNFKMLKKVVANTYEFDLWQNLHWLLPQLQVVLR